jgi:hypothetical protein
LSIDLRLAHGGPETEFFLQKDALQPAKKAKNPVSLVGRVRQHRNFEFAAKIIQADAPYEYKPIYSGSQAW